jgi:mono/diheme cytochrome c family protein
VPSFKILSHVDQPQIPWGVVRLEFSDEKMVFAAIAPHGPYARDREVNAGFRIAQQNCFRCHNSELQGGQKSGVSWRVLSAKSRASPAKFAGYIRNPLSVNRRAQMPANPEYDDATLRALTRYFQVVPAPQRTRARPRAKQ